MLSSSVLQMSIIWYITQKTGSAAVLSYATIAGFLPQAVLGIFIGALVDRYDRKKILIISDLFVAAAGLALFVAGRMGDIPVWLIMTVLAVRSVGLAFYRPALQAVIPLIIPRQELTRYAGITQSFKSMSLLASPALAAVLYPIWGLDNIVLLDVAGALLAVFAFAVVRVDSPPRDTSGKKTSVLSEVADGFRLMKKDATLMSVMIIGALYAIIYSTVGTLFPHITMVYFGGGVAQSSMVEIVFAIGMLAGSVLLGIVGGRINHMRAISLSIAAYGAGSLLTGLQKPDGFIFFVIFAVFMGVANPFFMGVQVAVFQLRVREDYLGRVLSLNNSAAMLARPVGLALSGLFADRIGINNWFIAAGACAVLLAAASMMLPSMRRLAAEPIE